MFGKSPRMTAIESRKRLLIVESEINRVQMTGRIATLSAEMRAIGDRTRSLQSVASSAAVLVAGLAAFQRNKPGEPGEKKSWLQTLIRGAGLVSTVWLAFRASNQVQKEE